MNTRMIGVVAISGSLRRGSYNTALLEAAAELAPSMMKVEITPTADLPMFNPDIEEAGVPDAVSRYQKAVAEADALLLATPEYNWSTTAAMKNAIDWASRGGRDAPLYRKPIALLGVGGRFGTLRAQLHLREILGHNQAVLVQEPQVFVDRPKDKFVDGRLTDPRTRDQVSRLLQSLDDLAR